MKNNKILLTVISVIMLGIVLIAFAYAQSKSSLISQPTKGYTSSFGPGITWEHTFGNQGAEIAYDTKETTDINGDPEGYIIVGEQRQPSTSPSNFFVVKTDLLGDKIWTRYFGNSNDYETANAVEQADDGTFLVAGTITTIGASSDTNIWAVKLDASGNVLWNQTYGSPSAPGNPVFDAVYDIEKTSDGGYIIAGFTNSQISAGSYDGYAIKIDANGMQQWEAAYGGLTEDVFYEVRQTSDGGYIFTGTAKSFGASTTDSDIWIVKTNALGVEEWSSVYGMNDAYDSGNSVSQTADGGYIVAGQTESFGASAADAFLLKTNNVGSQEWIMLYGSNSNDDARSVQQTADGNYIFTGVNRINGSADLYLAKTNTTGGIVWERLYGGDFTDEAHTVSQTEDEGYIAAGFTYSSGAGSDMYVIKTNQLGLL